MLPVQPVNLSYTNLNFIAGANKLNANNSQWSWIRLSHRECTTKTGISASAAQDFEAKQHNEKWYQDITYLWTTEGWLHLAVVIDPFSRQVVGWSMSERMTANLVCDALHMALFRRKFPQGVIMYSDRGCQYCSHGFQRLLAENKLLCSMSAKGNCYDNACAENFFHSKSKPFMANLLEHETAWGKRYLNTSKRSLMLSTDIVIRITFHLSNLNRIFTANSLLELSTIHGMDHSTCSWWNSQWPGHLWFQVPEPVSRTRNDWFFNA